MEKWKDIKGFEGIYKVSSLGRVKSLPRKVVNSGSYNGFINVKGRLLKQTTNRLGYKVMTLQKNGERFFRSAHRLVAEAFIDNPNNFKEVNHKDLDKSNNTVDNLEWCDRSYNINHFYKSQNTSSKHKGVSYQKKRDKWVAYVDLNKKRISLGRFDSEEKAYQFRLNYIKQLKQLDYEKLI